MGWSFNLFCEEIQSNMFINLEYIVEQLNDYTCKVVSLELVVSNMFFIGMAMIGGPL